MCGMYSFIEECEFSREQKLMFQYRFHAWQSSMLFTAIFVSLRIWNNLHSV